MKELVEKLEYDLSNIEEKAADEYIDVDLFEIFEMPDDIPDEWIAVARMAEEYYFKNPFHFGEERKRMLYEVNKETSQKIGFDCIQIHFYNGPEISTQSSNFIYYKKLNLLYIDLYYCETYVEDEVSEYILQELYNFKRDAEWVCEGTDVYDNHINEMKEKTDKIKDLQTMLEEMTKGAENE